MGDNLKKHESYIIENHKRNGVIQPPNPHLKLQVEDVLYHFALATNSHNLNEMFGDVKFVCVGGSPKRMEKFAHYMSQELAYNIPAGQTLINIAHASDRYAMYKVGPILSVSHGMGIPSISIMLHELIKLIYHAKCTDVVFIRIGTSGGLGLEPGSVVITETAVDELFNPHLELAILGKRVKRPSCLDYQLAQDICSCAEIDDGFQTLLGKTMCTMDFYEGQGRLDGAFCDYTQQDKMDFLKKAHELGIRNIEMESVCFAAMLNHAGIKGAVVCVTLLDRLKGDQVSSPHDLLEAWQERPQQLVARYIKKQLAVTEGNNNDVCLI